MSRKTQRYSKEFKAEAVRTVLENQLSISEGASRLSLPEGTLGQWVTAARKGLGTPGSRTVAELESEILQLRKALNEARLERDILKKATVDSIGQRNSYVKTWGCGGFLNETNIYSSGFAPIFPDICYHLTHYKPAAADIPVASDNPAHYADAIRYNARTPLQGSLLPLTRLVWA